MEKWEMPSRWVVVQGGGGVRGDVAEVPDRGDVLRHR